MNGYRGEGGGGWRNSESRNNRNNHAQAAAGDDWDEPAAAAVPSWGGSNGQARGLYGGGGGGGPLYQARYSMGPPAAMMRVPAPVPPLMVAPVGYQSQAGFGHGQVNGGRSWHPPGGSRRMTVAADTHTSERILRDPHAGMHIPRLDSQRSMQHSQQQTTPINRPVIPRRFREESVCNFCNRKKTVVMCQHCNFTKAESRVKLVCPKHPKLIFLSDWGCCMNCKRTDGLVELDTTAIVGRIGVSAPSVEQRQEPVVPVHETNPPKENGAKINSAQEIKVKEEEFDSQEQVVPVMKRYEEPVLAGKNKVSDFAIKMKEHLREDLVDSSQMNGNFQQENDEVTGRNHRRIIPEITAQLDEMTIKEKEKYKEITCVVACQGCGDFTEHEDMPLKPLVCNNETCYSKSYLKTFDIQGIEIAAGV